VALAERVAEAIRKQYGEEAETVVTLLEEVESGSLRQTLYGPSERLETAVLILAQGDVEKLLSALDLLRIDWRDLLVAAGIERADWPAKIDDYYRSH